MMENQHRSISGYRELSQSEIDMMNQIKDLGTELGRMVEGLTDPVYDQRCVALAKTNLQQGMMWAVRAVAQPTTFA